MESKQVIVMRHDLNMRKGKMCAQAAHASMKVFFDIADFDEKKRKISFTVSKDSWEWLTSCFTKVVVYVDSEKELLEVYQKAREANLPCSLITDAGKTEFGGTPTKTCCAIGPARAEEVNKITGHLKLL